VAAIDKEAMKGGIETWYQ